MKNLITIVVLILFVSCGSQSKQEAEKKQPNFIIMIADDAAWNDCGPYGNSVIKTPNIKDKQFFLRVQTPSNHLENNLQAKNRLMVRYNFCLYESLLLETIFNAPYHD